MARGLFLAATQAFLQLWSAGSRVALSSIVRSTQVLYLRPQAQQFLYVDLVASRHVGSQFPDQGSNPSTLHWKADY